MKHSTASCPQADPEGGTQDEPGPSPPGLLEPEPGDIQTVPVRDTIYSAAASFEDLPLSRELLQGLYTEMKFEKPSRIQALTLPMILTPPYRSLIAQVCSLSGLCMLAVPHAEHLCSD